jgi:hypothetical protein
MTDFTTKYLPTLDELSVMLNAPTLSRTQRVEFWSYVMARITHQYIQLPLSTQHFNAYLIPHGNMQKIQVLCDRLAILVGGGDPVDAAEELSFVIYNWGSRLDKDNSNIQYFAKGSILRLIHLIESVPENAMGSNDKDRVMTGRRRLITTGVLLHWLQMP